MTSSGPVMLGSYDYGLVVLSVLISILAASAALALAGRAAERSGKIRLAWLLSGATASGIGTWSMHYTGMRAFSLPVPVEYDWPTVLLSLLPAVSGFAVAQLLMTRREVGWLRVLACGAFVGGGIATMHYAAMASMRLAGMCHYSPLLVVVSVLLAVLFSVVPLKLTFVHPVTQASQRVAKAASVLALGAANPAMHYTAMAGTTFTRSPVVPDLSHAVFISTIGVRVFAIIPLMILTVALATSLADRLERERALLDELFEQAPQAVVLTDPDNRVLRVNSEFTRVFGYAAQETSGRRLDDLIVPDESREEFRKHLELAVTHGQRVEAEGVRRRKDGSNLQVSVVLVPVALPGEQMAVYTILHDITERKRGEEALRRSEACLAAGQQLSRTGSWALKVRSGELFWSQETYRIFGFDPAKTTAGIYETFLPRIHPDDRPKVEKGIKAAAIQTGSFGVDYRIVLPDGSIRYIHDVVYPEASEAGDVVERYGVIMDVTERKQTEEALQNSRDQLRALAARLQKVREEERTRVAREIHDELGQALTAIKIDLSSLSHDMPAEKKQQSKSIMKLVDETIQSVRRISTELRPAVLDALGLVAAVEWAIEEFEARTGTECQLDLPQHEIVIDHERATALFRIFQETLTNVARHANATAVNVRLAKENGNLTLEVHDNGKGIDGNQLLAGSSLGILGMRERALLLGGELTITSAPGQGTTVRARIPEAHSARAKEGM